jgi:hypothetical protein
MKTTITPSDDRPDFALESYSAPAPLPHNQRLLHTAELIGHTIAAMIIDPCGSMASSCAVVVTETRCWLVIEAENDAIDEEPRISLARSGGPSRVLSDYLTASDMLAAGLLHKGEFDAIRNIEIEKERQQKVDRAERMRKQLTALEAEIK